MKNPIWSDRKPLKKIILSKVFIWILPNNIQYNLALFDSELDDRANLLFGLSEVNQNKLIELIPEYGGFSGGNFSFNTTLKIYSSIKVNNQAKIKTSIPHLIDEEIIHELISGSFDELHLEELWSARINLRFKNKYFVDYLIYCINVFRLWLNLVYHVDWIGRGE